MDKEDLFLITRNKKLKSNLSKKKKTLSIKLVMVEKKNQLLTDQVDLDYLEILHREKFMVGKSNEHIYKSN